MYNIQLKSVLIVQSSSLDHQVHFCYMPEKSDKAILHIIIVKYYHGAYISVDPGATHWKNMSSHRKVMKLENTTKTILCCNQSFFSANLRI